MNELQMMKKPFRKLIAIGAVLATAVMLYLERDAILANDTGSWFWIAVGLFVLIAATLEMLGVGESAA